MSSKRGRGKGRGRPRKRQESRRSRYQDSSDSDSEFGNEFFDFSDITLKKPVPKIGLPVTSDEEETCESVDLLVKSEPEDYDSQKEEIREGNWSLKEKRALLEGIKKFGFHDYENIKTYVQTRTINDIKQYILNTRNRVKSSLSAQGLDAPQDPVKANLENWRYLLISKIAPKYRNDDFSQVLSEIMDEASKGSFPKPDGSSLPDFAAIYRFLRDILAGKMPGSLSPIDSWVLSQILQSIFDMAAGMDTTEEEAFLTRIINEEDQRQQNSKHFSSPTLHKKGRLTKNPREVAERMQGYLKWLNPLEIPPAQLASLKRQCQSWLHGAPSNGDDGNIPGTPTDEPSWLDKPQTQDENIFLLFSPASNSPGDLTAEEPVLRTLSSQINIGFDPEVQSSLLDIDNSSIVPPS